MIAALAAMVFSPIALLQAGVAARFRGLVEPWRKPTFSRPRGVSKNNAVMGRYPKKWAPAIIAHGVGKGRYHRIVHEYNPRAEPFVHVRRTTDGRRKWTRYTQRQWQEQQSAHQPAGTIVEHVDSFGCVARRERF
jgi:hypothetical protein